MALEEFMPGRELSRLFFDEQIEPILKRWFPELKYGAGFFGSGSDVLGYDTPRSMDHDWGPRLQVFVAESDDKLSQAIKAELAEGLPKQFRGFPVDCMPTNPVVEQAHSHTSHMVRVLTVSGFVLETLGIDYKRPIDDVDWLTFPEQRLLEIVRGTVFRDDFGTLKSLKALFAYYPKDVWLYKIACQWERIAQEEPFVGRCAETRDVLGMRVLVGRLVQAMMQLCFLLERTYAPYSKWFGKAFLALPNVEDLKDRFLGLLEAGQIGDIEQHLVACYKILGVRSNALRIVSPLDLNARLFFDRPYKVLDASRFSSAYRQQIQNQDLREKVGLFGAVDQFSNSTDMLSYPDVFRKTVALYKPD